MLVINFFQKLVITALTLLKLLKEQAFQPVLFTVIFRKFSRKAYREVKDGTTDINTYLSENLSGMKITQIFNREERKMKDFVVLGIVSL